MTSPSLNSSKEIKSKSATIEIIGLISQSDDLSSNAFAVISYANKCNNECLMSIN